MTARYRATLETALAADEVFAYLSDFSNARHWDPSVTGADKLDGSAVREGARFRLRVALLGREHELTYRVVEFDPPRAVTFLAENATVASRDRITFSDLGEGTRVTYSAELALKGPVRAAELVVRLAFRQAGERALAGLRRTLGSADPLTRIPLAGRALDGTPRELRGELDGEHNVILIAFHRLQLTTADQWLPWLAALDRERGDVATYQTVYADVGKAAEDLGLVDTETITVMLVDRSGRVLAEERGGFDELKARRLAVALDADLDRPRRPLPGAA